MKIWNYSEFLFVALFLGIVFLQIVLPATVLYCILCKGFTYLVDRGLVDWYMKRISDMFVVRRNRICQLNSAATKKQVRAWKKAYKNNLIKLMPVVSSFLNEDLIKAVGSQKLTSDKIYTTHTHLIRRFQKAERKGYLQIISIKPCKHKRILFEARLFIPILEIFKNLKQYTRQFYNIKFKVIRED